MKEREPTELETTPSQPGSGMPSATGSISPRENQAQLMRMVVKLFSMYPVSRSQNLDLAIEGYVEALMDTPWPLVSVGIKRLVQDPALTFVPPVGKIRHEAALEYRRTRGRQYSAWNIHDAKPNVNRLLGQARRAFQMPEPNPTRVPLPDSLEASISRIGKRMPE